MALAWHLYPTLHLLHQDLYRTTCCWRRSSVDFDGLLLQVVQPEGPSFQVYGHNVVWQQWHLHVGFNFREGLVLSHIGCGTGLFP